MCILQALSQLYFQEWNASSILSAFTSHLQSISWIHLFHDVSTATALVQDISVSAGQCKNSPSTSAILKSCSLVKQVHNRIVFPWLCSSCPPAQDALLALSAWWIPSRPSKMSPLYSSLPSFLSGIMHALLWAW